MVSTEEDKTEFIDGQQRLTSIYLILYYLEKKTYFSLDYQTRKSTRIFLQEKMELLDNNVGNGKGCRLLQKWTAEDLIMSTFFISTRYMKLFTLGLKTLKIRMKLNLF